MKRAQKTEPTIYPIENAERLAKIMGDRSATATALRELRKRQSDGEDVSLFIIGSWIFVGPTDTGSVT